jgi:hypothetical protein
MANEIQLIDFDADWIDIEEGQLTLSWAGNNANVINYNDDEAAITTAIEACASVGTGNVQVTKGVGDITLEFIGALANTDTSEAVVVDNTLKIRADSINLTEIVVGQVGVNEVQRIDLGGATTGTFEINFNGNLASVLTLDAAGIGGALDATVFSGNYNLTDNLDGTFDVEFIGAYAFVDVAEMIAVNNATDGTPSASTLIGGVPEQFQQFSLILPDIPLYGGLTVTLDSVESSEFSPTQDDINMWLPGGWTASGIGGNWTITANTAASSVTYSADEITPLRKDCGLNISTLQEGSGASEEILTPEEVLVTAEVEEPVVSVNALSISMELISCTVEVEAPTVVYEGPILLAVPTIDSTATVVEPTVTVGALTLTVDEVLASTGVIAPTVSQGAAALTPDVITVTTLLVDPTMLRGLYPSSSFVGVTTTVIAPSVMVTPISRSPSNTITITTMIAAPTIVGGENTVSVDDTWRRRNYRLARQ